MAHIILSLDGTTIESGRPLRVLESERGRQMSFVKGKMVSILALEVHTVSVATTPLCGRIKVAMTIGKQISISSAIPNTIDGC